MRKHLVAAVIVVLSGTGSMAGQEFYVVKESKGRGCEIKAEKPDAASMVGTKSYATREEAKNAKRAAPECAESNPREGRDPQ
jgi:hypothetical protein